MTDDLIGQTLGQYRIEALLGSGGMGQVFRGTHIFLDRPAAIKVMQAHLAINPDFRSRFLQEAKAAAALRHPNIVEIYEFGEQEGNLYLVMELMTDGSLRTILRRNAGQSLPLAPGLDLIRQAANGLAAANALKMVHRDIKPDNLLLTRQSGHQQGDGQYLLKISDFGLARLAQGGVLTNTGLPMGTLAYMSPEQCQGKQLDGRSDLYSLGIVLYEVVTGYQPFQINDFSEALDKHVHMQPPPPARQRPDLPPEVEEIVLRCLAKKPEDRFATGTELASALQRVLSTMGPQTMTSIPPVPEQITPTRNTVMQSPGAGGTPPPVVSTLATYTAVPRVRVLDQSGQTLQAVEVRSQGLIVGRQPGNDIVLQGEGISRQHLQVLWDGKQVTVKDLGSSNGTLLGNERLLPQVGQPWMERQLIRIGPFWLRLEGPSPAGTQTILRAGTQTVPFSPAGPQTSTTMVRSGRIGMAVDPRMLTITPGLPVNIQVTLTNLGTVVDWFTTTIEGVAPEWVQGAGQEVQLNPGTQEAVELHVNVARSANNLAREYLVTIRSRSREKPDESGITQMHWTVLPFEEGELHVEPRRASGRGKANYAIRLRNGGNTTAGYSLSGDDDEQKLAYRFGKNEVGLDPGKEEKVPMTVQARRHWLGKEQRKPFHVHARPAGKSIPLTTSGEFVNKALLPGWLIPVFLIAALGVSLVVGSSLGLLHGSGNASPTPMLPAPTVQIPTSQPTTGPSQPTPDTQATANAESTANAQATANANGTVTSITQANATVTAIAQANATATANASLREINNNDPGIKYTGSCGYNHGLSSLLYNDDVEICRQQNDSFTYTFTGTSIYLVTVYYQNHGGTITCYIDGSGTQTFNLDSSDGVDSSGLRYGVVLPIAPQLTFSQHTASCIMTSASGTYFFVDALIINK